MAVIALLLSGASMAFAAFDPVNDDTDIFLANPSNAAERPNVLIILDNTENWNQAFANEKNALVRFVNGLSDQFNVGLMMFPEIGSSNVGVDGGYVRYHVRRMTSANKIALSTLINSLDIKTDKGKNAATSLALHEAFLYYSGKNSIASHGQVKADKDVTTNPLLSPLTEHALPAGTTSAPYRSPVKDGCARNFVIYISNGPAAENASARSSVEAKLATLTGVTPPSVISIAPSGLQGNWADEMARFMANADVMSTNAGIPNSGEVQNVYTYVVEVNPASTGQGPDMTALMKSVAANGKGRYLGVTGDASGTALVDALNSIISQVQAVNSVFASTTLPVSVNARGTNLNQVYVGVFRPDPARSPRWMGNLKMYNLALNPSTDSVYLADAANGPPPAVGNVAENAITGFVSQSASSFWGSHSSSRHPGQNAPGVPSDFPDGDMVEKGGVAQQLRIAYANAEASVTPRNLYTCTAGDVNGANQICKPNSGFQLSRTPFTTGNAAIDGAALGSSAERDAIIRWVRGQDNYQDENSNASLVDIRASIHGDVLHSRPAVVNYNRYAGSDDDVVVFYGANDGIFRAIKGGYAVPKGDTSGMTPGGEIWGFVPEEFFSQFKRLRDNSPAISSSFKRPYFMDGPIGVYTKDGDTPPDGKLGGVNDVVNLYITSRRGGRFIYALDVNNPAEPKYLWRINSAAAGFSELGQTWSQPTVVTGLAGLSVPVLIFGAGYDPIIEDLDPATISTVNATSAAVEGVHPGGVTTTSGVKLNRGMGRGIFVVNALTGALIWTGSYPGSGANAEVPGMVYAIPSDVTVVRNESGGPTNRAYVGDTGGNMWRIDFKIDTGNASVNLNLTTVTKLASVSDQSAAAGRRKFMFPPDVVGMDGFDAVLIGSGDREHPFDETVVNRFYMFKDRGRDGGAITGASKCSPTITEAASVEIDCVPTTIPGLSDLTTNCIQDAESCLAGETQEAVAAKLRMDRGWFLTSATGEKVVGNAISIGGTTFFNTNQPSTTASGGTCGSNLGVARQYQIAAADATATTDLNATGGLTRGDRALIPAGGGYLPPPVHAVVHVGGKPVEAVISGIQVSTPKGATLSSRLRKYWYKEIDPR